MFRSRAGDRGCGKAARKPVAPRKIVYIIRIGVRGGATLRDSANTDAAAAELSAESRDTCGQHRAGQDITAYCGALAGAGSD